MAALKKIFFICVVVPALLMALVLPIITAEDSAENSVLVKRRINAAKILKVVKPVVKALAPLIL